MNCKVCGFKSSEGDVFCKSCGAKLVDEAPAAMPNMGGITPPPVMSNMGGITPPPIMPMNQPQPVAQPVMDQVQVDQPVNVGLSPLTGQVTSEPVPMNFGTQQQVPPASPVTPVAPPMPPTGMPVPPNKNKKTLDKNQLIIIILGALLVIVVIVMFVLLSDKEENTSNNNNNNGNTNTTDTNNDTKKEELINVAGLEFYISSDYIIKEIDGSVGAYNGDIKLMLNRLELNYETYLANMDAYNAGLFKSVLNATVLDSYEIEDYDNKDVVRVDLLADGKNLSFFIVKLSSTKIALIGAVADDGVDSIEALPRVIGTVKEASLNSELDTNILDDVLTDDIENMRG